MDDAQPAEIVEPDESVMPVRDAARGARVAALGTPEKPLRKPSRVAQWRFFWMRRSGARTAWALVLAIPALLAAIYLALPTSDQTMVVATVLWVGQSLGATGLRVVVEVTLVVCALASLALLLAPGYRQYRYLHLPTSTIAPISVYVDTENIKSERKLAEILGHLRAVYLATPERIRLRADLLFFMDAKQIKQESSAEDSAELVEWKRVLNQQYRTLIHSGFRLINSPHNVTGKGEMAEAVDREIALHAFERALLGGITQEFVIASGDGDYAPLIYRLIALGHSVQIWTWGETEVYDVMERAIPTLKVERFSTCEDIIVKKPVKPSQYPQPPAEPHIQPPAEPPAQPPAKPPTKAPAKPPAQPSAKPPSHAPTAVFRTRVPPAVVFPQADMGELYFAIYNTIGLSKWVMGWKASPESRVQILYRYLNGDDDVDGAMWRSLAAVGYEGDGASASWVNCLLALDALMTTKGGFPAHGPTVAPVAARRLYAMARAAAQAAVRVADEQVEVVSMGAVRAQLVAPDLVSDEAQALLALLRSGSDTAVVDTHYLVWCARAVGLLTFVEVPESPMLIRSPQLTPLPEQIIHPESAGPADAPQEGTGPADIPPTE